MKSKSQKDFYKNSEDWTYDMYQSHSIWLRRSLIGLIALFVLLGFSLVTNVLLFPLKEKVPYLYAFDHATGEVTKIGVLEPSAISSDWAVAKYFLIHYVINRESYDMDNIELPYQLVFAQSSDDVRRQYVAGVKSTNADSPYQRFAKEKYITVRVISVNRLNDNTVDMKFEKTLHDRHVGSEVVSHREAIVKWEFVKADTTLKMLERNPLGFKVTYYQTSQVNLDNN